MKKIVYTVSVLLVSAAVITGLCSFTSHVDSDSGVCADSSCQGKHCSYTVGCDCSGFAPKTNGSVADQSYCKRCGHHRRYHK